MRIIVKPAMVSEVFILVPLLKLRQLLESALIHSPNFPMPWTRSTHQLRIFWREADSVDLEIHTTEITASYDLLFLSIPFVDDSLSIIVSIWNNECNMLVVSTEWQVNNFSAWRLINVSFHWWIIPIVLNIPFLDKTICNLSQTYHLLDQLWLLWSHVIEWAVHIKILGQMRCSLDHLSHSKIARLSSITYLGVLSIIFLCAGIHTCDSIMLFELHVIIYNISYTNMSAHRVNNSWLIWTIEKVQWASHTSVLLLLNEVSSKWISIIIR